jgi:hypothetical protein
MIVQRLHKTKSTVTECQKQMAMHTTVAEIRHHDAPMPAIAIAKNTRTMSSKLMYPPWLKQRIMETSR